MIRETIVVEGKNDAAAVKRAVDADIIITSGFGITGETLRRIRTAQDRNGVIVLTDPDFMGEKIRNIISTKIKGVKHAFVPREEALEDGDIGIENASPESIQRALATARTEVPESIPHFTAADMIFYGLSGDEGSAALRGKLGAILGIGYGNAKQLLVRLNRYGIAKEEFEQALEKIIGQIKKQK